MEQKIVCPQCGDVRRTPALPHRWKPEAVVITCTRCVISTQSELQEQAEHTLFRSCSSRERS